MIQSNGDMYITLINKTHSLPEDWLARVELISVLNDRNQEFRIEKETFDHYRALKEKLFGDEGIQIDLDSVYRSLESQQQIWDEFMAQFGEAYCRSYAAVPGYSEHHTGLAIDICLIQDGRVIDDNDEMMDKEAIFARVHEYLPAFGFILRYPKGKEAITGYSFEPWHLRYVGVTAATEMARRNLTLEEYLDQKKADENAALRLS